MGSVSQLKACPVVIRQRDGRTEILAFKHPAEKLQIVKGTIDPGESPGDAACRELFEESGLIADKNPKLLAISNALLDGNTWYFYLCDVFQSIPDNWDFETLDDGGHMFRFFWHPIEVELNSEWHPLFHSVFKVIQPKLYEHLELQ